MSVRRSLLGASLSLCALVVVANELAMPTKATTAEASAFKSTAEPPTEIGTVELKKSLQQLNTQIKQLRQTTVQTGQLQQRQSAAISQQIDGMERRQHVLNRQLQTLNLQSLQQIEALQAANRKLIAALWLLIGGMALLLGWVMSHRRRHKRCQAAHEQPGMPELKRRPTAQTEPTSQAAGPGFSPDMQGEAQQQPLPDTPRASHERPAMPALERQPTDPTESATLELKHQLTTEQALAQAHDGFMQPVRIDS